MRKPEVISVSMVWGAEHQICAVKPLKHFAHPVRVVLLVGIDPRHVVEVILERLSGTNAHRSPDSEVERQSSD